MEKNLLIRIVSSIPIVGTALALWLEHTEMGRAQYGAFLGLLRGLVIGAVIAGGLLAASEAAIVAFEIVRFWVNVHFTSHYLYAIGDAATRKAVEEENRPYDERHKKQAVPDAAQPSQRMPSVDNCPTEEPIKPCFWILGMGKYGKLHYILGVQDAVSSNHDLLDELFRGDWTHRELIEQLDKFYANGAHADVPVIDAMRELRGR